MENWNVSRSETVISSFSSLTKKNTTILFLVLQSAFEEHFNSLNFSYLEIGTFIVSIWWNRPT
jgi:hypothetical protein